MGGICLNWGCIPTKALLRTSEINHLLQNLDQFGFSAKDVSYDTKKIVERSRKVAKQLSDGVKYLLRKNKVDVVDGEGKLAGPGRIAVAKGGKPVADLRAKHIILATGARARSLPGLEPDGKLVWTYKEAMIPPAIPKSLLVVGSGAIGIEFASFYRDLGADVTVVEVLGPHPPGRGRGDFGLRAQILREAGHEDPHRHDCEGAEEIRRRRHRDLGRGRQDRFGVKAERVVLAVGIVGNVENIGLEGTKVKVEKSHIVVDQWLATGEPGVYAIGDVVGPPWLAHKASHEGVLCVERIAGLNNVHPLDVTNVPGCTYCRPQVASVGLTEKAAKEQGYEVKVGRFPYIGNGKAIALGEPEGLVKTVFDAKTGALLGAHMIGAEVTELIQGYVIARTLETTEQELIETIFPHPTLSETMHESVLDAYGRAIHF